MVKAADTKSSAQHSQQSQQMQGQPFFNKENGAGMFGENVSSREMAPAFFVQRKPAAADNSGASGIESRLQSSKGSGKPLPSGTREHMEQSIGSDFSGVRVHTGGDAAEMNGDLQAQAFTHGKDIYFNSGKYDPASKDGQHLLAHELTHVVQQGGGRQQPSALQFRRQRPTEDYFHLPLLRADEALVNSMNRLGASYVDASAIITDVLSLKLRILSINYEMAYDRYAAVIGEGAREAANQTMWNGIMLGIATGVLAGVAAAYIAPSTAGAWFTLTLADGLTAAGSSLAQATASAGVAVILADAMTEAGSNMQPGGLSPAVLNSRIWQHMASMYRGALNMNRVNANLAQASRLMTAAIGEARVQVAGGASAMTQEQLLADIDRMIAYTTGAMPLAQQMSEKATALRDFNGSVNRFDPMSKSVDEIERDIWIMWMASLSDSDSDIIDLDAIEDHLLQIGLIGPGGRLGVDFGLVTEEVDELNALRAARTRGRAIQDQYDQTVSRWVMPEPPQPGSQGGGAATQPGTTPQPGVNPQTLP